MLDVRDSVDVKLGSCTKGSKVGLNRRVDIRHSRGMHIHHTSPTPTETKVVLLRPGTELHK